MKWKTVAAVSALTMSMSMVVMGASIKVGTETVELPKDIKVFDIHHVPTPQGEVDLLTQAHQDTFNEMIKTSVKMNMERLGVTDLAQSLPQQMVDIQEVYQLAGENEQGRHVALVVVSRVSPEMAAYDEAFKVKLYPSMKSFYEAPATYTPEGYQRWKLDESKYQLTYDRSSESVEKMKGQVLEDAKSLDPLKQGKFKTLLEDPRVKSFYDRYMEEQDKILETIALTLTKKQPGKAMQFRGHKAMHVGARGYLNMDGYKFGAGYKGYTVFMPDHMLEVTMLTFAPSYNYWNRIMDQAMQGGKA